MREFTKLLFRLPWAMSVFGLQQTMVILSAPWSGAPTQDARRKATPTAPTGPVAGEFDESMKRLFKAGDDLQSGMVDLMFNAAQVFNPTRWAALMTNTVQRERQFSPAAPSTSETVSKSTGWGPVPPPNF